MEKTNKEKQLLWRQITNDDLYDSIYMREDNKYLGINVRDYNPNIFFFPNFEKSPENMPEKYKEIYSLAEEISTDLKIEMPYIAITEEQILRPIDETTASDIYGLHLNTRKEIGRDIVIISKYFKNDEEIEWTLAHELRHCYQYSGWRRYFYPYEEVCTAKQRQRNKKEVDADAYAISWFMRHKRVSINIASAYVSKDIIWGPPVYFIAREIRAVVLIAIKRGRKFPLDIKGKIFNKTKEE